MNFPYTLTSRSALRTVLALLLFCATAQPILAEAPASSDPIESRLNTKTGVRWYDAKQIGLEGKAFQDTKAYYDRLPARAEKLATPRVWKLSRATSGMAVRFVTDSPDIYVHWRLTSKKMTIVKMAATAYSGVDLYVRTENNRWRWLSVGQPESVNNTAKLVSGLPKASREYLLYLPLYNGIKELEIGVPDGATLSKAPPRPEDRAKPILFYGTSITHGACASRPGMTHVAILGRRFDRPVINLGFSGNGRMEKELAPLFAEIDAAVYVLDCVPNMHGNQIEERAAPFVKQLRDARPKTPIVMVEDRTYPHGFLVEGKRRANQQRRLAYRKAYEKLIADGVNDLYYVDGNTLLGDDGDDTADGSHPSDLGFYRQANTLEKVIRPLLHPNDR